MKLPNNADQIVSDLCRHDWYFLTKRADVPPIPVWLKIGALASGDDTLATYGTYTPWAGICIDKQLEFYIHAAEYKKTLETITTKLYSPGWIDKQIKKLKFSCELARQAVHALHSVPITGLNNDDLLNLHLSVSKVYGDCFVCGFFTWNVHVLQADVKKIIAQYGESIAALGLDTNRALGVVLLSGEPTFYREKEQALQSLAQKYQSVILGLSQEQRPNLAMVKPDIHEKIIEFLRQYEWVGFDYCGPAIAYDEVVREIAERSLASSNEIKKEDIIKACQFTEEECEKFRVMSLAALAKDLRNQTDDYVHYYLADLYTEIGRRFELERSEIQYLWPEELEDLLSGTKKFSKEYIAEKQKACAIITLPKTVNLSSYYFGDEAADLKRNLFTFTDEIKKQVSAKELQGMVASPGKVQGQVKIVYTHDDLSKVEQGDILVAYMTSPRFMPAIIRCGAIVTNDGGLTCHAAIITREMNKPCIVGTRNATEVLKDGDQVEVDATTGIVRIL